MQAEAARAAGTIGEEQAVPRLAQLVLSEELTVALTAVHALGQIGGDTAYRVLNTLIEDPDFEHLHEAATDALEELDWLGGNIGFGTLPYAFDDEHDVTMIILTRMMIGIIWCTIIVRSPYCVRPCQPEPTV
jgi:hypothetical protein